MPRMREDSDTLASDLFSRLERLVAAARKEGRESALSELRSIVGGSRSASVNAARRGPGRPKGSRNTGRAAKPVRAKSKKPRKNPWAAMTPEQKADRVRKMLAGRGLKPKSE